MNSIDLIDARLTASEMTFFLHSAQRAWGGQRDADIEEARKQFATLGSLLGCRVEMPAKQEAA